jgi:molecular chaperone IbpA
MFEDDLYITTGNYPPYNIVKTGSQKYNIEVALAGYGKDDIHVDFAESLLTIKSVKEEKPEEKNGILHKGIAKRHFSRTFTIADDVEVKDAELKDGLLKVFLHRIVPEGKEARQIKIN